MKLFTEYLKGKLKGILFFCLCAAAFIISFVLYGLPAGAVLYPAALCAAGGLVFIICGFISVKRKHEETAGIKNGSTAALAELPGASTVYEKDLLRITELLKEELLRVTERGDAVYRDTVDYYTAWAHQIKTPIASMRLQLENEDALNSRRLSADLARIERYADMVLTYIKTEHDGNDLVLREHGLPGLVKTAVRGFAAEFIDRGMQIRLDVPERSIITDEKWFIFVMEQLISNALKYSDRGTVSIYLKGDILCVEDEGEGIEPSDLPRIFEKGYTGYNGRTFRKATGLGLYLCSRLCGDLGIGISAASEPGKGTVMMLDLSQRRVSGE